MKTNIFINIIIIVSVFSWSLHSQKVESIIENKKMRTTQLLLPEISDTLSKSVRIIKSYKVVETINKRFGGYTLTYIVSNPNLVRTNNLGPGNTRVVTPIYKIKKQPIDYTNISKTDLIKPAISSNDLHIPIKLDSIEGINENEEISNGTAYVSILRTYERVLQKGYKSIEMLKKVANGYYFIEQLDKAAKFYEELFSLETDLEPEYYFRYAQSLKFINKTDKADKMMDQYNKKMKM